MKLLRSFLVSALLVSLVPVIASADEPSLVSRMQTHVEADFLRPLVAHDAEASGFSRMRMPPRERRVRMTATAPSRDQAGQEFLTFAIDGKLAKGPWHENDIVGCVYPEKGEMFVKLGNDYRPASVMLGSAADAVPNVCKTAAPARA